MAPGFNPFDISLVSDGTGVSKTVGKVCGVAFAGTIGAVGFAAGAHVTQSAFGMTPSPVLDGIAGVAGLILGIQAGDDLSNRSPSKSFCLLAGALVAYGAHQMFSDYHLTHAAAASTAHDQVLLG